MGWFPSDRFSTKNCESDFQLRDGVRLRTKISYTYVNAVNIPIDGEIVPVKPVTYNILCRERVRSSARVLV
jgi:hypothetical protein